MADVYQHSAAAGVRPCLQPRRAGFTLHVEGFVTVTLSQALKVKEETQARTRESKGIRD
jgi:hypothetical protein